MKLVSVSNLVARRVFISILAASALAVALPEYSYAQADPYIGTWRLNVARSTFTAGPTPRSNTVNVQGAGANMTATAQGVDAAGNATRIVFMRIYDGQLHPTTGSPDWDSSAYTRVDANTVIITRMKGGKLVGVATQVLSQDGRTWTLTDRGVTANGQPVNSVTIYEKQ